MPTLRKVLTFSLIFLPVFLICFAIYVWIFPVYDPFVVSTANFLTNRMEPATYIEMRDDRQGGWRAFSFSSNEGLEFMRSWTHPAAHLIYLSIVTLPALLLATPAPFKTRLRLLAISLPLMFIGHVLSVIILMRTTHCLIQAPGTFTCLWFMRLAYSSGQLLAGTFWVVLTWRYWFPDSLARAFRRPDTEEA